MAKYDDKRTRNDADYNKSRGENLYNNSSQFLGAQAQQFQGDYGRAQESDTGMRNAAMSGYSDFANTGGFSPTGLAAIRSRSNSPIRAAYSNAERNVNRMGNNIPGKATLMARMAREQGQAGADATTNTEAGIAQMVQQGRLAGNQGISQLYGTTPGATSLQSRNVLENTNQGLQLNQMENQRMQGLLDTQLGLTRAPGNTDTTLNQIGAVTDIGKKIFAGGWQNPFSKPT